MEPSNNGNTLPQVNNLLHQVKPPAPGMGYTVLSHWPKGPHRTSKHHSLLPRLFIACSPQPDSKVLFPKDKTSLRHRTYGQLGAVTSHGNERYSHTLVTCLQVILAQQWQRCHGSNQPLLKIIFKTHLMRWNPCLTLLKWTRT